MHTEFSHYRLRYLILLQSKQGIFKVIIKRTGLNQSQFTTEIRRADIIRYFFGQVGKGLTGSVVVDDVEHARSLGSLSFNADGEALPTAAQRWQQRGLTTLALRDGDGTLLALFAVGDVLRNDAHDVVQHLQGAHKEVVMISGDQQAVADAVGAQLHLDAVLGEVSPEDKLQAVQQLQQDGTRNVLFVGDGVNDGPALAQANIGMTLSSGTDVALLAADVVSMRDTLAAVPTALALGKATARTIRQNLFWAFCYNVVALPLAAVGLLSPVLAGAAMALSSTSVVLNALWLRRFVAPSIGAASPSPSPAQPLETP